MSAPPIEPPVRIHIHAGVAAAALDRPKARNTLNQVGIGRPRQSLAEWASSSDAQGAVLRSPARAVGNLTLAPLTGG